jgi:hypothetical protein
MQKLIAHTKIEGLPRQRKHKDRANKKENGTTDELLGPRIKIESDWFLHEKLVTCIKKRRATRRVTNEKGLDQIEKKGSYADATKETQGSLF